MKNLLPARIEGVRSPRDADERTLRMCFSEVDAIRASVALCCLSYEEIGARMGVSKQLVGMMVAGDRNLARKRIAAFCNATGTNLYRQYQEMERAIREAAGRVKERDRIAAIVAPTEKLWRAVA